MPQTFLVHQEYLLLLQNEESRPVPEYLEGTSE